VHVDISPQCLLQFRRTLAWTGDKSLLRQQWPSLQSAYRYNASLVSDKDGLPCILRTIFNGAKTWHSSKTACRALAAFPNRWKLASL
jgi:uncharacterized protein (DUF608 family)